MDKFQYLIRKQQWPTLTTKKSKLKFVHEVYKDLNMYLSFHNGTPHLKGGTTVNDVYLVLRCLQVPLNDASICKDIPTYIHAVKWFLEEAFPHKLKELNEQFSICT